MGLTGDCDLDSAAVLFKLAMWLTDDRAGRWLGDVGVDKMFLLVTEGEELLPRGTVLGLSGMTCNGGFEVLFGALRRALPGVDPACLI